MRYVQFTKQFQCIAINSRLDRNRELVSPEHGNSTSEIGNFRSLIIDIIDLWLQSDKIDSIRSGSSCEQLSSFEDLTYKIGLFLVCKADSVKLSVTPIAATHTVHSYSLSDLELSCYVG